MALKKNEVTPMVYKIVYSYQAGASRVTALSLYNSEDSSSPDSLVNGSSSFRLYPKVFAQRTLPLLRELTLR